MADYQFAHDEYVVLKAQEVRLDSKKAFSSPRPSELMLTNHNIVMPRRGLTGKVKGYDVYPLANIRIVDGKPQCRLDTSDFMETKLEVSFVDQLVSFEFGSLEAKREIREWINSIYQILLGVDAPEEAFGKGKFESFFEEENIADMAGRVFGSFENAFQRKRAEAASDVSGRCPSCDASVKGRPGETITCPFCGGYVTL